ncbi:Hypothetical_protein [Hexamita inflata]|uniref:Hypothetical_protein n=1 Tax=Hexamita inflata TaxID=28002 RepID=A0AA86TU04_9EUKA|nr:Hypothetical protein HINF_LOCUS14582 [Hexamita inflata]
MNNSALHMQMLRAKKLAIKQQQQQRNITGAHALKSYMEKQNAFKEARKLQNPQQQTNETLSQPNIVEPLPKQKKDTISPLFSALKKQEQICIKNLSTILYLRNGKNGYLQLINMNQDLELFAERTARKIIFKERENIWTDQITKQMEQFELLW